MSEQNTDILVIVDHSGSMQAMRNDVIGGYNAFIEEQRGLGNEDARFTLVQFSDKVRVPLSRVRLSSVPELSRATYVPAGSTALLDAIGMGIVCLRSALEKKAGEKGSGTILVAILTDGQENASKNYTYEQVTDLIEECRAELGWQFLFLGADQSAIHEAARLHVPSGDTVLVPPTSDGMREAFRHISAATTIVCGPYQQRN